MSEILTVIILGIVEGVTEFLPVSSTGHLILATRLLGFEAEQWALFNVVIQLGAILAIVALYWRTVWTVVVGVIRREAGALRFARNILVAFLPAAIIGLAIHRQVEALLGNATVVAVALAVGGVAIIVIERVVRPGDVRGVAEISLPVVVAIGFIQCLAMVPGVSRSGATILGALFLGVERRTAAEFSFFLAIPTMLGASTLEVVKNRAALTHGIGTSYGQLLLGSAIAFVVALFVVRWFVNLVGRHGFSPFGWYRIAVGLGALVALNIK